MNNSMIQSLLEKPYLFFILFPVIFISALYLLSKRGWAELEAQYQTEDIFTGDSIGMISGIVKNVRYNNALVLKYNQDGIYLQGALIFKLFQKPVLIPWKDISVSESKKTLFRTYRELVIGEPVIARLMVSESEYKRLDYFLIRK
ncbi:MAG TPA: hypothetical protein VK718_05360 [Ferruginibacter sp.]|jgi:hypothetical protein|nr:hypothetical protein [Ferruginibacter sp.]